MRGRDDAGLVAGADVDADQAALVARQLLEQAEVTRRPQLGLTWAATCRQTQEKVISRTSTRWLFSGCAKPSSGGVMLPCLLLVRFFSTRLRLCALTPRQKVPCCPAVLTRGQSEGGCLLAAPASSSPVRRRRPWPGTRPTWGRTYRWATRRRRTRQRAAVRAAGMALSCGGSRSGDDVRHDVEGKREVRS